jgi:lipoate-protein ligase A
MASVKLNKKSLLEKLQAKVTLKLGKKMTQQEILDKSIEFVYKRLDAFISEELEEPKLTKEIIERIRSNTIKEPLAHPEKSDDELIYDL